MRAILCVLIGLTFSIVGCSQETNYQIDSYRDFLKLSSAPLYQKYGQVSSVKIVYDTKTNKLYFVPSDEYEYHHNFCEEELGYRVSLGTFNKENYSGEADRPFLLANINYYQAIDKYTLELGPSDRMNPMHLKLLFEAVKKDVFFGDRMYLMLNTTHVQSIAGELSEDILIITPEEIYDGQTYQPISKRSGKGRVLVVRNWMEQADDIRPTDILLLDDIPASFPLVSGVIVTRFQTPLSHVSLLGTNRKIPICAYTKLFNREELLSLDGKTVEFTVEQDTFRLIEKEVDLSKLWKRRKKVNLKRNLSVDSLIPIKYLKEKHSNIVGNKAANFGELVRYAKDIDFKTPESAFAIPFSRYECHIKDAGVQPLIDALLAKDNLSRSTTDIKRDLNEIRGKIIGTPVNAQLIKDVEAMIIRLGDFRRMRFRSSTNAEDRKGFSGAGLYTSKTGRVGSEKKPVDRAIRKVWASLWSYDAFMEREAFHLDHADAAMGILVHRSFPDEEVNGVAITTNLYRPNYLGFVINAQLGDENVVAPSEGVECDQFICYPDKTSTSFGREKGGIDVINYSSLNDGKLVMTEKEIQHLANVLEKIKYRYLRKHYTNKSYFDFGLDLEFKLDRGTRQLYIKQMRIYNN